MNLLSPRPLLACCLLTAVGGFTALAADPSPTPTPATKPDTVAAPATEAEATPAPPDPAVINEVAGLKTADSLWDYIKKWSNLDDIQPDGSQPQEAQIAQARAAVAVKISHLQVALPAFLKDYPKDPRWWDAKLMRLFFLRDDFLEKIGFLLVTASARTAVAAGTPATSTAAASAAARSTTMIAPGSGGGRGSWRRRGAVHGRGRGRRLDRDLLDHGIGHDGFFDDLLIWSFVGRHNGERGRGNELKLQAGLAGGIGEGFDFAMVAETAAIEHHLGNIRGLGALGHELTDFFRALDVRTQLGFEQTLLGGEGADERLARDIVDHLGANVAAREIDGKARPFGACP